LIMGQLAKEEDCCLVIRYRVTGSPKPLALVLPKLTKVMNAPSAVGVEV